MALIQCRKQFNIVLVDGQKYCAVGWLEKFVQSKKKNRIGFPYDQKQIKAQSLPVGTQGPRSFSLAWYSDFWFSVFLCPAPGGYVLPCALVG